MDQVVNSSQIGSLPLLQYQYQPHKSHLQQILVRPLTSLFQRLSRAGAKSANARARRKIE